MNFEQLQAKVARAEDSLEAHERQAAADFRSFGGIWRDAWSPPRVVAAGLAAGFLAGWARPARAIAGIEPARWLQLAGSLAGLVGSLQASFAAQDAQEAAEDAGEAVAGGGGGGGGADADGAVAASSGTTRTGATATTASAASRPPSERRYAPDPAWDTPPRPAEAATELSEPR